MADERRRVRRRTMSQQHDWDSDDLYAMGLLSVYRLLIVIAVLEDEG